MNRRITYPIVAVCSIIIGLYPLVYFLTEMNSGLLSTKSELLLKKGLWNIAFYTHISLGGLALLIGWSQFNRKLRKNNVKLHRDIGKVYMICVFLSGSASLYLAYHATGGFISTFGFLSLGIIWMITTLLAFVEIKNGHVSRHQKFMTYSFAACFAAVTLRVWLPLLSAITGSFILAYQMSAWLCWVPNIIVAYFIIQHMSESRRRRFRIR